ncbi:MAG: hypothetical protein KQ78_01567 [Candidatus Izimaplasma bacterium HR2]|nr:MAG: hypothetical protein KQ78_01567 [Candidatus Izimaplasma bacterium HR2]
MKLSLFEYNQQTQINDIISLNTYCDKRFDFYLSSNKIHIYEKATGHKDIKYITENIIVTSNVSNEHLGTLIIESEAVKLSFKYGNNFIKTSIKVKFSNPEYKITSDDSKALSCFINDKESGILKFIKSLLNESKMLIK